MQRVSVSDIVDTGQNNCIYSLGHPHPITTKTVLSTDLHLNYIPICNSGYIVICIYHLIDFGQDRLRMDHDLRGTIFWINYIIMLWPGSIRSQIALDPKPFSQQCLASVIVSVKNGRVFLFIPWKHLLFQCTVHSIPGARRTQPCLTGHPVYGFYFYCTVTTIDVSQTSFLRSI